MRNRFLNRELCPPGVVVFGATFLLVSLWIFPQLWYRSEPRIEKQIWLGQTNLSGWRFEEVPVGKTAEAELVADKTFNGVYSRADGTEIRAFAAFSSRRSDTAALFAHTPDRCWTASGWQLVSAEPGQVLLETENFSMPVERRVYQAAGHRELVYFGAFVGGEPFQQRLDQYLGFALRRSGATSTKRVEAFSDILNLRFAAWPWKVFSSRVALTGSKLFFRVSTPLVRNDSGGADALLRSFAANWINSRERSPEKS